jgi:hypothetical protein
MFDEPLAGMRAIIIKNCRRDVQEHELLPYCQHAINHKRSISFNQTVLFWKRRGLSGAASFRNKI